MSRLNEAVEPIRVREIAREDKAQWRPLWEGYNSFYGRVGDTALPDEITSQTWERFFDTSDSVNAVVAEINGAIVGIAHYVYHPSTTRLHDVCYFQDLFTCKDFRGKGIGGDLIRAVYRKAQEAQCSRVYWTTHSTNVVGQALYDKLAKNLGFIVYTQEF